MRDILFTRRTTRSFESVMMQRMKKSYVQFVFIAVSILIFISTAGAQNFKLVEKRDSTPQEFYTHQADLNFIFLKSWNEERKNLPDIINRLQKSFDTCKIFLNIEGLYNLENTEEVDFNLEEWETFWFNSDEISPYERVIFSKKLPGKNNVLFLDSLNFTLEGQGTMGIAYPQFLLDHYLQGKSEQRSFFQERMMGNAVLGLYRARWTLAHELGHALMNLEHIEDDFQNIMWSGKEHFTPEFDGYFLISNRKPEFSKAQCEKGYLSPFIKVINR